MWFILQKKMYFINYCIPLSFLQINTSSFLLTYSMIKRKYTLFVFLFHTLCRMKKIRSTPQAMTPEENKTQDQTYPSRKNQMVAPQPVTCRLFICCIGSHAYSHQVTTQCIVKVRASCNVASQHIKELP